MENNQTVSSNVPARQFNTTGPRAIPELEEGRPYFIETTESPEPAAGVWLNYWRLLVRNNTVELAARIGGLLLGVVASIAFSPVCRASTTLEVLNVNQDFMNMRPTQSAMPGADSDSISEEETQATLLQSDPLLGRVYMKLDPNPTPPAQLATTGWRSWFHLRERMELSAREKLLAKAVKT